MKNPRVIVAVLAFVIVMVVGGLFILAEAPIAPPVEKVEQVIPNDQIQR